MSEALTEDSLTAANHQPATEDVLTSRNGDALIEAALAAWDGEMLICRFDRPTGAWIVIAIHSTRLGPATGGTRMRPYPSLAAAVRDAMRLSEGMTLKFAVADFPRGGGKTVLAVPNELSDEARAGLLQRYGAMIHQLGGLYETGPDVGTGPEDMDRIALTGAPYVHCRTVASGGAGDSAPATAAGTFEGIRTAWRHASGCDSLFGARVVVQGAGSVGWLVIRLLRDAGADVRFAEVRPEITDAVSREMGVPALDPDSLYDQHCDVFAPCALGAILNQETIPRLHCSVVAGCANNQLATPDDAERLHRRGILYAPDFVVSLGGAVAITGIEAMGWTPEEATARIIATISLALQRIFDLSQAEDITTTEAAKRLAQEHLAR